MTPCRVVVVHPRPMVGEGIAAGLARHPPIVPVGVATSAAAGQALAERADAVVVDQALPGGTELAGRLRESGVRVVVVGRGNGDREATHVPVDAPLSALAEALVPRPSGTATARARLTSREWEVLRLVAGGLAGKQVARRLGISPKTVEQHKTRIYAKLGVRNQTAAVACLLTGGLGGTSGWSLSST